MFNIDTPIYKLTLVMTSINCVNIREQIPLFHHESDLEVPSLSYASDVMTLPLISAAVQLVTLEHVS